MDEKRKHYWAKIKGGYALLPEQQVQDLRFDEGKALKAAEMTALEKRAEVRVYCAGEPFSPENLVAVFKWFPALNEVQALEPEEVAEIISSEKGK